MHTARVGTRRRLFFDGPESSSRDIVCGSAGRANVSNKNSPTSFPPCMHLFNSAVEVLNSTTKNFFTFVMYRCRSINFNHFPVLATILLDECADLNLSDAKDIPVLYCRDLHLVQSTGTLSCLEAYADTIRPGQPFYYYFDHVQIYVEDNTGLIQNFSDLTDFQSKFSTFTVNMHVKVNFFYGGKNLEHLYYSLCYYMNAEMFNNQMRAYREYQEGKNVVCLSSTHVGALVNVSIISSFFSSRWQGSVVVMCSVVFLLLELEEKPRVFSWNLFCLC